MAQRFFKIGQIVEHRASGRKAVVSYQHRICKTGEGQPFHICSAECEYELIGLYDLSLDLGEEIESVPEYLICPVLSI